MIDGMHRIAMRLAHEENEDFARLLRERGYHVHRTPLLRDVNRREIRRTAWWTVIAWIGIGGFLLAFVGWTLLSWLKVVL